MPSVGSSREMEGHEAAAGIDRVLLLVFCVAGIWSAYIYQGVLQETASTKLFGPDGKRFEHLSFLNLAQNAVCFLWSLIMIKLWSRSSSGVAPLWSYWSPNISNTIGPSMGIEALKYISYPAQTSSKAISKLARPNAPLGYGLCFLNLAFDGFTNATQDSIKARYPETTAWDIMLGMNLWGTIYNVIYMFGWPHGSGYEAVRFCQEHPEAASDILVYCLCGAVGQNFIFLTISRFGSLANTTITTTRKFVSIVVSSLISGNPLSPKHWASVVMVFSGLSLQIFLKWRKIQRTKKGRKAA
ncbi:hypothetical protein C4D60_Mb10t09470 [Musa balbisiana]|uniref:UDP-galactose/UDP-glucose transporter 3 n=1 Tax=Musa balbisiana TaxID=52838 RepID=A0A4S8IVY5_MUSBA|nr:hypothetical protein C4D60_Mb10t09470 [Musa balbisiana]